MRQHAASSKFPKMCKVTYHQGLLCYLPCRSWYSNLPIVGETWAGWCSPLEEGLVAPFLTSHPPPCTSRCVFYLPEHHLLLPSICLVQLPARFLYLCVCIRPTMHLVCIPCCAIHLPRPTSNTLSAFSTIHLLPCRPILPLALPPLGPTTGCTQCSSLLWSRVAAAVQH